MKKVRFDTAGAIEFQLRLGRELPPDERKPVKLEGWLVDGSLFPWDDRNRAGFFAKDDAITCAKEISALKARWVQSGSSFAFTSA